jgi:chromosomal replication initiation ATPase DnaA
MTVEQIGMLVNRDHATVSITTKVVRSELDTNAGYRKRYMRLKNNIENQIEDGKELC